MSRFGNLMLGALLGGLIGSALALLFAPSSGEGLRNQVRETIVEIQDEMRQAASARRIELEKQLTSLRAPQN